MAQRYQDKGMREMLTLGVIWFCSALSDRLWFALDRSVPAWDQADYLTWTLTYWRILQHPQGFSGQWWVDFWMRSSKIPPLTYILTAPFLNIFGPGPEQATLVHLLFSAILLGSVYGLGSQLFNRPVGLWAAGLCVLLPGLYRFRLQFLLDYPLAAMVTFSFYCLTMWWLTTTKTPKKSLSFPSFFWAIAWGISLGLAILVKQTAVLFLLTPIVWIGFALIRQKAWKKFAQFAGSLLLSLAIFGPWVQANWLLILTAGKRATVDSAIAEGDPALNSLEAWTYYWSKLPEQISWLLLLIPLVGILLKLIIPILSHQSSSLHKNIAHAFSPFKISALRWLAVFWLGAYLINSLNINKDARYVLPYLPVFTLLLAYGLMQWPLKWGQIIRWGTVSLALLLMVINLWPIGGGFGERVVGFLSPAGQYRAKLNQSWPHAEVITEITQTEPFLRTTLGILPSTPEINQHNLNYFGALQNLQVYGRQVGTNINHVPQDVNSLSWFVTKTGLQGSIRKRLKKAQALMIETVEKKGDFQVQKSWILPDGSNLLLYHRQFPLIEVHPLTEPRPKVQLDRIILPENYPAGVPLPVTYEWSGSWQELETGLVLLTWKKQGSNLPQRTRFIDDHGIGMGALHPGSLKAAEFSVGFKVIERTAVFPPANLEAGVYTLEATYLNRKTGETYPITVPQIQFNIDPTATVLPAPELDLVTQLRQMARQLPKGIPGLEPIFNEIGRINQYDPVQDYVIQAEQALEYRLKQEPNQLEWAYALALARVLQRQPEAAIAALERVVKLDSNNPYAYAYLAFVHLYNWQSQAAKNILKSAFALNPNLPEIKVLYGIAELMQGNLLKAWQDLQAIRQLPL